jgi:hypothetical protein
MTEPDFQGMDDGTLRRWIEDTAANHRSSLQIEQLDDKIRASVVVMGRRPDGDYFTRLEDVEAWRMQFEDPSERVTLEKLAAQIHELGWRPESESSDPPAGKTSPSIWADVSGDGLPILHVDGDLINLTEHKGGGIHPLQRWVCPLVKVTFNPDDRTLVAVKPLGTAFAVGLGIFVTAYHTIESEITNTALPENEVLMVHFVSPQVTRNLSVIQTTFTYHSHDFAVLITRPWIPNTNDYVPVMLKSLSVKRPKVGSRILAFGYPDFKAEIDHENQRIIYDAPLKAAAGTIQEVLLEGTVKGWPLILCNSKLPNGISGGPVIGPHGNVCGIVSAGAESSTDGNEPHGLVAMLQPLFDQDVAYPPHEILGPPADRDHKFWDLAERRLVKTDGSHKTLVRVEKDGKAQMLWSVEEW